MTCSSGLSPEAHDIGSDARGKLDLEGIVAVDVDHDPVVGVGVGAVVEGGGHLRGALDPEAHPGVAPLHLRPLGRRHVEAATKGILGHKRRDAGVQRRRRRRRRDADRGGRARRCGAAAASWRGAAPLPRRGAAAGSQQQREAGGERRRGAAAGIGAEGRGCEHGSYPWQMGF